MCARRPWYDRRVGRDSFLSFFPPSPQTEKFLNSVRNFLRNCAVFLSSKEDLGGRGGRRRELFDKSIIPNESNYISLHPLHTFPLLSIPNSIYKHEESPLRRVQLSKGDERGLKKDVSIYGVSCKLPPFPVDSMSFLLSFSSTEFCLVLRLLSFT